MPTLHTPAFEIVTATALPDKELLRPILESAVIDATTREVVQDEVEDILRSVPPAEAPDGQKHTLVAWSPGTASALGMMSLMPPGEIMTGFAATADPIELTNAYVHADARGLGVGRVLVQAIEELARQQGHTEIILNSGPRFELTGWPFWRRMYGDPMAIAADYYGPELDAPVWHKSLTESD